MHENLFTSKYVKSISCDKPQQDQYEVANLLNCDDQTSYLSLSSQAFFYTKAATNGFIVDSFIRPPVTIQIIFREPVNIDKILLDAKVNTKVSSAFSIASAIASKNLQFQQIAKWVNDNDDDSRTSHIYEFINRLNDHQDKTTTTTTNRAYFSIRSLAQLQAVSALNITILRTLNSSTPCLKSIRIFGPWSTNSSSSSSSSQEKAGALDVSVSVSVQESSNRNVEIPSEFIDEITHEMIRNPIRLPSNKFIDATTLQRLDNKQIDPFTRVAFTRTYAPIIDELLKSQIDKFLFDNSGANLTFKQLAPRRRRIRKPERVDDDDMIICPKVSKSSRLLDLGAAAAVVPILTKCECCLNFKSEANDLYELTLCKHVYCRHCVKSMDGRCVVCKATFTNCQIVHLDRKKL
jgi:hypothetical protein